MIIPAKPDETLSAEQIGFGNTDAIISTLGPYGLKSKIWVLGLSIVTADMAMISAASTVNFFQFLKIQVRPISRPKRTDPAKNPI